MVRRLDEKIRKLDEQLMKHKDIIRKTRPGPGQEAAKRRALMVRGMAACSAGAIALSLAQLHCLLAPLRAPVA